MKKEKSNHLILHYMSHVHINIIYMKYTKIICIIIFT